jgi:hypothetical protein
MSSIIENIELLNVYRLQLIDLLTVKNIHDKQHISNEIRTLIFKIMRLLNDIFDEVDNVKKNNIVESINILNALLIYLFNVYSNLNKPLSTAKILNIKVILKNMELV